MSIVGEIIHEQHQKELTEAYTRGQEDMRAKVVAFLLELEQKAKKSAEHNHFIRREAMALYEAAELIERGKEIPGGFDA